MVALFGALSVVVWTLILLSLDNADLADVPHITAGDAVPVKVTPVVDMESLKLKGSGRRVRAKLPAMWDQPALPRPAPKAAPDAAKTQVSTAADPNAPTPEPSQMTDDPDGPEDEKDASASDDGGEGGAAPSADPGAPDGDGGGPPASGDGKADAGAGDGGTEKDPLRAFAYKRYLGRVQGALSGGYDCKGVPDAAQKTCRVRYTAAGLQVTGFTLQNCDPALAAKANAAAATKVGMSLPPPPEQYPEFASSTWTGNFSCRK
ncbi:MAG: hypothetical protein AAGN82_09655 [Myxococcota bacterium]